MPNDEDLAKISVGRDTRDSVTEAVGTPGVSGVLNNDGYYYVASRMRHYGATAPKEVSREVLAISFDSRGIVRNIERFGLEQGRVIALNRRVTDNGETDRTFIRQLLGNLGNIGPGAILDN
ncbi:MAG: cell envelope protein SmpA [Pseudooceanicola sp.]|jgi:outer membrane protein assembly factor BamE (lipoprotein component of BamABCDE complex)|uniref:Outer membrane protein assembly factor BamE n=2 Tax=Arenibacterium halophilum TaxID=2583821 RepID=A0ABY2XGV0_9RHOB|nr:cell envelope protein SmpA [Pseudooceanicola sp.]TMV15673.1 outer membrane protein assembly factor BamE [Arenibacterium halophilum]|tara:strand:- start:337 stop:699 length:363 start_codon:yes stop_codon:yes gene_type:complete